MKSKRVSVIFGIVFALGIMALSLALVISVVANPLPKTIFSDLGQLDKVKQYITQELSPSDDENISGLNVSDSLCCAIKYNGRSYVLHAYEFEDTKDAHMYFCRIKGTDCNADNEKMRSETGLDEEMPFDSFYSDIFFHVKAYSYYGKCAYLIEGTGYRAFTEFYNWLSNGFPVNMENMKWEEFYN